MSVASNGEAARLVAEQEDYIVCAALGPKSASNKYSLNILNEAFEDQEAITTFFLIAPKKHKVAVGNRELMQSEQANLAQVEAELSRIERAALTAIIVAIDGRAFGVVGIADPIRPGASEAIKMLNAVVANKGQFSEKTDAQKLLDQLSKG